MTLLRKVVSENCFCKTFKWNPLALYTLHIYMEISLNLLGFTDLFYKEILTNFISFSSMYTFSFNLLLKASVVWAKNYKFSHFFLRGLQHWFRTISQTSELKFITKTFSGSTWFIHFDVLCNYLHSIQKHPAVNYFENKCCFFDQEHVGHYNNKFTETELEFFIKNFWRAI